MDDLRFTIRRLRKQSAASFVSVAALACSISAVAVTWSLLSATLLKPLAVADPDRLMVVGRVDRTQSGRTQDSSFTLALTQSIGQAGAFTDAATYGFWSRAVTARNEDAQRSLSFATPNFFRLLGVPIALGRDFGERDNQAGVNPVAILSDRFWRKAFNADPSVIGQRVEIGSHTVEIVGVAARGFSSIDLAQPVDLFLPLNTAPQIAGDSNRMPPVAWRVVGRLHSPGGVAAIEAQLTAAFPDRNGRRFTLTPIETAALAEGARPAMTTFVRLLSVAVGLLLLIGCGTVGVLLLLRTEARRDEFAMCLALGASRADLARGVMLEAMLLVGAGSLLSAPLAASFLSVLQTIPLPGGINAETLNITFRSYALALSAASGVSAALVAGFLVAALRFSAPVMSIVQSRAGSTPRTTRRNTRAALIVGQVAVSVVLVAGAGLLARSLAASLKVNPGFETAHLLTGSVSVERDRFTPEKSAPYFAQLRDRLDGNPAIRSVSLAAEPSAMSSAGSLTIDGIERRFPSAVRVNVVDERYFSTIGLSLLAGRDFTALDDARVPLVVVVSESFGRMIANGGDPLGRRIRHFHGRRDEPWPVMTIIGVVPDVITNVAQLQPLAMYFPVAQSTEPPHWRRTLFVRPAGDIEAAKREIVSGVRNLDPSMRPAPSANVLTMSEQIARQMGPQRLGAFVLAGLSGIALLLTVLGTYVLAESMAVVRRREMGIRAALGASRRQLGGMVLAEAGRFVGIGLAIGLLLAWAQAASVRALLFRVEPLDPATLVSTAALILILAAGVSLRPAIAAARVDLARVLRDD